MTRQTRRTLAAALATATALAALFPVLEGGRWFWRVLGTVAVVAVAGVLVRAVRLPSALQPVVSLVVLLGYLCLVFAQETLSYGLVPTQRTADALRALVESGQADLATYAPPVVPSPGIVLLVAAGAGTVALLVDLVAVVLDRVALAGLPLLALFAVPSAVLPDGLGGTVFAIGASGWLVLLLEEGSERVGRWGTPLHAGTRGSEDSSLGRVGRRIGVAAVGLALFVPALVPGLDQRLIGGNGSGGEGGAGGGASKATTYNPLTTLQDQLTLPEPRQLFVYSTDDPSPDYVRMTTLDTYDGNGWRSSKLEADREDDRVQRGIPQPRGENDATVRQDLTMRIAVDGDNLEVHWLPVPFGPRRVEVEGNWLWDAASQTVFSASRTTKGLAPYTVSASRVLPTRGALQAATPAGIDLEVGNRYGSASKVSRAGVRLAEQVTATARTPYERAVALQDWFTDPDNGFVYDVTASPRAPGQDALDAFLGGRRGFCEQYATAMAAMLRVVGLPSRVAVGFTSGRPVPGREGTYSVTTSDAHAWPEAWFPGSGWVRFEPTPAASGATTPDYTLEPSATPTAEPSAAPTPGPTSTALPRGFRDPDDLLRNNNPDAGALGEASHHLGRWALGGGLVLLVLATPMAATALRRRARLRQWDPLVAWDQVRDDVHDAGGPWRTTESPRTLAARLGGLLDPAGRDALGRVATAAELVRYAQPGRASSEGLAQDVAAVRRSLLAGAPRGVRWRAVALTPSTLHWLSHLVAERVADVLDLSDRVLAFLYRPARRVLRLRA